MPNVVICYKWVIDEADIRIDDDLSVDFSRVQMKISDFDRNAIEAGIQIARSIGGKAVGLTYGNQRAKKSIKDALSRGLDELVWISDDGAEDSDSLAVSKALAAGVEKVDDVSVVITAEGSSDVFARQTAPRLAAILGWPVVTCAGKIDIEGESAVVVRQLEDSLETVKVNLPVVISVVPEICEAPLPGLKQIMAAGKKPSVEIPINEIGGSPASGARRDNLIGYASNRKNVVFESSDEGCINELIAALHREGVL